MARCAARGQQSRWFLFGAAFASVVLLSGVVFGWPNMRRILRRDGLLTAECEGPEGAPHRDTDQCASQELDFGLIYTAGSWSNQFSRLPVGMFLDRFGPRMTVCINAVLFGVGCVIFGISSELTGLAAGFVLIGIGGAGVQLAVQNTSSLFPARRSMAMATLSGAFQFASLIYLIFELVHLHYNAQRSTLLLVHSCVAGAVAIVGWFIWPDQPFTAPPPQVKAEASLDIYSAGPTQPTGAPAEGAGKRQSESAVEEGSKGAEAPEEPRNLRDLSFYDQATSREYLLMLCWFSLHMLPAQFTVGTIGQQLELKGDSTGDHLRAYSAIFAASALVTPLAGLTIDRMGFPTAMLAVNTLLTLSYAVLIIPLLDVQPIAYVCYSVGRVCLWAVMFSFCGAVFGFRHYGKLAGGGLAFGACLSLLQYPALDATLTRFDSDYLFINSLWCALSVSMYTVVFLLRRLLPGAGGTRS